MWVDNETDTDFLNFSGVADTVAEIVYQANGRPISIGVSGAWGAGKSSMIKLIQASLRNPPESGQKPEKDFVFVEFNAWLYQGYDDARAALMDVIASRLQDEAEARQTALDKVYELGERVNWLRVAKIMGGRQFLSQPVCLCLACSVMRGAWPSNGGLATSIRRRLTQLMTTLGRRRMRPNSSSNLNPRSLRRLRRYRHFEKISKRCWMSWASRSLC